MPKIFNIVRSEQRITTKQDEIVKRYIGIILNTHFPKHNTISLLDQTHGKQRFVLRDASVSVGALVEYTYSLRRRYTVIDSLEVVALPFSLAKKDILFLHHVLEICHYFIPEGSCETGVFQLLHTLYTQGHKFDNPLMQKIFLAKLFMLLGMHPELEPNNVRYFERLLSEPIDKIIHEQLDLVVEQELGRWIYACVIVHPLASYFKTIHFLDENTWHETT